MIARVGRRRLGAARARLRRSTCLNERDLLGRQRCAFLLRRHPRAGRAGEHVDEQSSRSTCPARSPARVAALDERRRRIEPQARLLPQRAVARVAARRQDRLDLRDVIDALARVRNLRSQQAASKKRQNSCHAGASKGCARVAAILTSRVGFRKLGWRRVSAHENGTLWRLLRVVDSDASCKSR